MPTHNEYSEISIEAFFAMTGELPFGVYVKLNDHKFTLIFKKGDQVEYSRFEQYAKKGVTQLYIHKNERREYIVATEILVNRIQGAKELNIKEAQVAISELTKQTLFEIYEDNLFDDGSLRRTTLTVRSIIDLVKMDPKSLTAFIHLSRNESYGCRQAIATMVFSILLARAHRNDNEKMLSIIGLGALLHDIGMSQIPKELNDYNRNLTPDEWELVKTHPKLGVKMIEDIKTFPEEVKVVIEQHHESWDGTGYPLKLKASEIYYPARIVSIADAFSALTTKRGGRPLYKPEDALALLLTEKRKFDPDLIKAFRSLFHIKITKAA